MRVSVTAKALAVLGCLATTCATLGVTAYWGLRDLRLAGDRIARVKDFEIEVGRLEQFNRARRLREGGAPSGAFRDEFARAEALAAQVSALAPGLPRGVRDEAASLGEHLRYLRSAFEELFARYAEERRLQDVGRDLHRRLYAVVERAGSRLRRDLPRRLHDVAEQSERAAEDRDYSVLADVRRVVHLLRLEAPGSVVRAAESLLVNAERAQLNHLGVADREKFLADTARRFSEVSAEVVRSIAAASRARQERVQVWLLATMGLAAFLTLALWRFSLRYISAYLASVHGAAESIHQGRYEYPAPEAPRDEAGDVLLLLRNLSGSLGESIRRVEESESRYRSLVEGISDWVWEMSPDGRFTYASPVVRQVLGFPPEEVVGRRPSDFVPPEDARRTEVAMARALARQAEGRAETAARSKDGRPVVVESSWKPIRDAGGAFIGFRGLSRDVTERQQAEAEQARLRAQLLRAQKLEAVGTLAGGIAHDFNNLLQSISGYLELLLRHKTEDDPDYGKLKIMEQAVERAADLTRNLLVFSRKAESRSESVGLNRQILEAKELLGRTIPKMIELRELLAPDLWPVEGDPSQIQQVLMNLALNARDAMSGGGTLTFETANIVLGAGGDTGLPSGRYVRLDVSDTGSGMSPETASRAFEPFFTTKEVGKGTGLGLSTVYGIVQAHRGYIACRSRPGEGTQFEIYLPAVGVTASVGSREDAEGLGSVAGGETILLVDDEEAILSLGVEILEEQGYTAFSAHSGEEALAILASRGPIDLVVLDLNMPGMGGLECLRRMKGRHSEVKVVVASGYPPGEERQEMIDAGARAFVRKPYRLDQFLGVLRRTLDGAP